MSKDIYTLNIPKVVREGNFTKNCKMILSVGCIVLISFILINSGTQHKDIYINTSKKNNSIQTQIIELDKIQKTTTESSIMAKTVVLYNLNKRTIPVRQIIIIDNNHQMIYIHRDAANIIHPTDNSVKMYFNLPYEIEVIQIIVDSDQLCDYIQNITTTQVELQNAKNVMVWSNSEPMNVGNRYAYLRIVKPNITYQTESQKLCTGSPGEYTYLAENNLNEILQKNIWS